MGEGAELHEHRIRWAIDMRKRSLGYEITYQFAFDCKTRVRPKGLWSKKHIRNTATNKNRRAPFTVRENYIYLYPEDKCVHHSFSQNDFNEIHSTIQWENWLNGIGAQCPPPSTHFYRWQSTWSWGIFKSLQRDLANHRNWMSDHIQKAVQQSGETISWMVAAQCVSRHAILTVAGNPTS